MSTQVSDLHAKAADGHRVLTTERFGVDLREVPASGSHFAISVTYGAWRPALEIRRAAKTTAWAAGPMRDCTRSIASAAST